MNSLDLVAIDQHGLAGSSFYWDNRERYQLSVEELAAVGVQDQRIWVHCDLIPALLAADRDFQQNDYRLFIREGYRSKELYALVFQKRSEMFGSENVSKLLNMTDMPHASGRAVDVALFDLKSDEPVATRGSNDGPESLFVDFYKNRSDPEGQAYQQRQALLRKIMETHSFSLGTLREYFHFGYRG